MEGLGTTGEPPRLLRTPDQRLRVFVSSTLGELAAERAAVRAAVERMRLIPVMFELSARPHPPAEIYRAYLAQSHVFVGVYWQRYGFVAAGETVSGLEDEYQRAGGRPKLLYIKEPAREREPRLGELLATIKADDRVSYRKFGAAEELGEMVAADLALLLSERFDAAAAAPAPPTGLPAPLTAAVGRESEVAEVLGLLEGGTRLLTLTGPGGVGKTRLALEAARAASGGLADGAYFVALGAITQRALALPALAQRLGVRLEDAQDPVDALATALGPRQVLLVLDNLEQLAGFGADLARLLERCPRLHVLATSRHPLRVLGERELRVAPLRLPDARAAVDEIGRSPAVRLFFERAVAVRPDFRLTDANAAACSEVCRRLDGLPLALELAAGQIRLLPPERLCDRLDRQLDAFVAGPDAPERQRTLRATIEWSVRLLDETERALFARFSVFAGSAALDAVEEVCAGAPVGDPLGTAASLVEKSLLGLDAEREAAGPGVRMLETLRDFAREQLDSRGESRALRRRHFQYYAALARRAQPHLCGRGQSEWCVRLDPERANLRAAVAAGLELGETAAVLRLVWDTFVYYYVRGAFHESAAWVDAVSAAGGGLGAVDRARLDTARAIVGAAALESAAPELAAAAGEFEGAGLEFERAVARHFLGLALWRSGRRPAALDALRAASLAYAALAHDWGVAKVEATLGAVSIAESDPRRGVVHCGRALEHARRIDNRPLVVSSLLGLALVDVVEGRPASARRRLAEAAELARADRNATGAAYCLEAVAALELSGGDSGRGARALAAARALRGRLGIPKWMGIEDALDAVIAAGPAAPPTQPEGGAGDPGGDPFALLDAALASEGTAAPPS